MQLKKYRESKDVIYKWKFNSNAIFLYEVRTELTFSASPSQVSNRKDGMYVTFLPFGLEMLFCFAGLLSKYRLQNSISFCLPNQMWIHNQKISYLADLNQFLVQMRHQYICAAALFWQDQLCLHTSWVYTACHVSYRTIPLDEQWPAFWIGIIHRASYQPKRRLHR